MQATETAPANSRDGRAVALTMRVADLMTTSVLTVLRDETITFADAEMRFAHITHLPVVEEGGRLVGLVERNDLLHAFRRDGSTRALPVGAVMHDHVFTAQPAMRIADALKLMLDHKLTALPVVDDEQQVVGIVTASDFLALTYRLVTGERYAYDGATTA